MVMGERQTVKVSVLQKDVFGSFAGSEYTDDRVSDVIRWLQATLDAVPSEFRDDTFIDVDSVGGYEGDHHVEIEVYYKRPETDEEMRTRHDGIKAAARAREAQERAALAVLKAKYEKANTPATHTGSPVSSEPAEKA